MGVGTRIGKVADPTAAAYAITWSANEPTVGNAATIADGDSVTDAESGQAIADLTAIVNALVVDNAAMRAQLNEGE